MWAGAQIVWRLLLFGMLACDCFAQTPASKSTLTNVAGGGGSFLPVMSANGQRVAFVSSANNLVRNDDSSRHLDVFVHELATGQTELVSVTSSGFGGGDGNSNYPTISSNGQFLAFASDATNLVPDDTNGFSDIFVRDLSAGTTRIISLPATNAIRPVISPNGRYVAFEARDRTAGTQNLYLRDIADSTQNVLTLASSPWHANRIDSFSPCFSGDNSRIAFVRASTNSGGGLNFIVADVYVHTISNAQTIWASPLTFEHLPWAPLPAAPRHWASKPLLSYDGERIAFKATVAGAATPASVIVHDLPSGDITVLTKSSLTNTWPAMTPDGRYVAYESTNSIYRWDAVTRSNVLVNVPVTGEVPAGSLSTAPMITPDARHVAFLSTMTNLVTGVTQTSYQIYVRDLDAHNTRLVTMDRFGGEVDGRFHLATAALGPGGNFVVFDSAAENLVDGDLNKASDIFVRNIGAAQTHLVSLRHDNEREQTAATHSTLPDHAFCISSNGAILAFTAVDNNYSHDDTNGQIDVFAVNLSNGAVTPVSAFPTNRVSRFPVVSANGEYVIFYSQQPVGISTALDNGRRSYVLRRNVVTGVIDEVDPRPTGLFGYVASAEGGSASPLDGRVNLPSVSTDGRLVAYTVSENNTMDVYLADMLAGTNQLVSLHDPAAGPISRNPRLSPNNRWLVFETRTDRTASAPIRLYARDLASNATVLVSADTSGNTLPGMSTGAVVSATGRYVYFQQWNGYPPVGYRYDFESRESPTQVCANCFNLTVAADDTVIAFASRRPNFSTIYDIVEKNLITGVETVVTMNRFGTARGNGTSESAQISRDGRFVLFESQASDLVPNDFNRVADVFVRDRTSGVTMLLSRGWNGLAAGGTAPVMAADGRTVVFHSTADGLVGRDLNEAYDIFVVHLGAGDSDNDGLDDSWELAHFDELSRDGSGDHDQDGQTDRQEFLAGTNPRNAGSALTVLSLSRPGSEAAMLLWSAVPGRRYQVQYKEEVSAPWTQLPEIITATGYTAAHNDATGGSSRRFYRVVLVE